MPKLDAKDVRVTVKRDDGTVEEISGFKCGIDLAYVPDRAVAIVFEKLKNEWRGEKTVNDDTQRMTLDEVRAAVARLKAANAPVEEVFPAVSFIDVTFDVEKMPAKDQIIDMVPERPLLPPKP